MTGFQLLVPGLKPERFRLDLVGMPEYQERAPVEAPGSSSAVLTPHWGSIASSLLNLMMPARPEVALLPEPDENVQP